MFYLYWYLIVSCLCVYQFINIAHIPCIILIWWTPSHYSEVEHRFQIFYFINQINLLRKSHCLLLLWVLHNMAWWRRSRLELFIKYLPRENFQKWKFSLRTISKNILETTYIFYLNISLYSDGFSKTCIMCALYWIMQTEYLLVPNSVHPGVSKHVSGTVRIYGAAKHGSML